MRAMLAGTVGGIGLLAADSPATTYFVDSVNGSDSYSGTSPTVQTSTANSPRKRIRAARLLRSAQTVSSPANGPWKSISRVNAAAFQPGDDIYFKRGCVFTDARLLIYHSGTEADRVIVGAYGTGSNPVIDTSSRLIPGGIYLDGPLKAHITVRDLVVRNVNGGQSVAVTDASQIALINLTIEGNATKNGIFVKYAHHILIDGAVVRDVWNSGIALIGSPSSPVSDVTVRNCLVQRAVSNDGITVHHDDSGNPAGANFLLEHNRAEDCGENGFDITTGSGIRLTGNVTLRNGDSGILVDHTARDVTILYHESYDEPASGGAGVIISAPDVALGYSRFEGASYHFVQVYGNANGAYIFNNLFIVTEPTGTPVDISTGAEDVALVNNIFYSPDRSMARAIRFLDPERPPDYPTFLLDHNLYWGTSPGDDRLFYSAADGALVNFDGYRALYGVEAHGLLADPKFVAPQQGDYRLAADSPAVEGGTDLFSGLVTVDAAGGAVPLDGDWDGIAGVDIGCYERDPASAP